MRGDRHPLDQLATRNNRALQLICDVVPEYQGLKATADAAEAQALTLRSNATEGTKWPASPNELTADWLDQEVKRRLGTSDAETRIQVLTDVMNGARADGTSLLDIRNDELIAALAEQLAALVVEVSSAVDELGPGVNTAAQAIEADAASAWKSVGSAIPDYEDIRTVQVALYNSSGWELIDRSACGDSNAIDPAARLYYHRNLDVVAPEWKPGIDFNGGQRDSQLPWPSDPTERLVWCIRHDSGIWCPTGSEVQGALAVVPPRLEGGKPGPRIRRDNNVHGGHQTVDQSGHMFRESIVR